MNAFEQTRQSFKSLPDDAPLLDSSGELSKNVQHKLNTISKPVFFRILEYAHKNTHKLTISTLPRNSLTRVSVTLKNTTIPESDLHKSRDLQQTVPQDIFYRLCQHQKLNIAPLNPVDGLLAIHTPEYTGIITQNGFEENPNRTAYLDTSDTILSFYLSPEYSEQTLRSWIRTLSNPQSTIKIISSNYEKTKQPQTGLEKTNNSSVGITIKETTKHKIGYRYDPVDSASHKTTVSGFTVPRKNLMSEYNPIFALDIHIQNNTGEIYHGPHAGLIPIKDSYYSLLSQEFQQVAFPKSKRSPLDIQEPYVTEGFENTDHSKKFFQLLYEDTEKQLYSKIRDLFISTDDVAEKIQTFDDCTQNLFYYTFIESWRISNSRSIKYADTSDISEHLEKLLGITTETDYKQLKLLLHPVRRTPIKDSIYRTKKSQMSPSRVGVIESKKQDIDGDVYMAVNPQPKKNKVLQEDSKDHLVVKVQQTEDYEIYANAFDWKKQKDITYKTVSEFDISDQTATSLTPNSHSHSHSHSKQTRAEDTKDRKLTIHTKTATTTNKSANYTYSDLQSLFENSSPPYDLCTEDIYHLVLFPQHQDPNLSDHKDELLSNHIGLGSPRTKKEFELISSYQNVYTYPEFTELLQNLTVLTKNGTMESIDSIMSLTGLGLAPVFHIVSPFEYSLLREKTELIEASENLLESEEYLPSLDDNYQYIPVTPEDASLIHLILSDQSESHFYCSDISYGKSFPLESHSIYKAFVDIHLKEYEDFPEAQYFLNNDDTSFTEETVEVITTIQDTLEKRTNNY